MEELTKQVEELKAKYDEANSQAEKAYDDYENASKKLQAEKDKLKFPDACNVVANMLSRISKYVNAFIEEEKGCCTIRYAFNQYMDKHDYDVLSWEIHEYPMNQSVDIVFHYKLLNVREFVKEWMSKYIPCAEFGIN